MHAPPDPNTTKGFTFALAGMVFLSCNYITAKYGLRGFNPESLTVVWMGAATVYAMLWTLMLRQARRIVLPASSFNWLVAMGLANAGCQLTAWQSLDRMDPSLYAFLQRFSPMMAILMGTLILHERVRRLEWLPISVMVFGGMVSVLAPTPADSPLNWLGVGLCLLSAFLSAAQLPLAKLAGPDIPVGIMNLYRIAVAFVAVSLWGAARGKIDFSNAKPDHWGVVILGALLGPFISYVCTFRSYRHWDMARSSMVMTLQPLVVVPMAFLAFGLDITQWQLIGGFVTLAGGFWLAAMHRKADEDPIEVLGEQVQAATSVTGAVKGEATTPLDTPPTTRQ